MLRSNRERLKGCFRTNAVSNNRLILRKRGRAVSKDGHLVLSRCHGPSFETGLVALLRMTVGEGELLELI